MGALGARSWASSPMRPPPALGRRDRGTVRHEGEAAARPLSQRAKLGRLVQRGRASGRQRERPQHYLQHRVVDALRVAVQIDRRCRMNNPGIFAAVGLRDLYSGWDAMGSDGTTRRGFLARAVSGAEAGVALPAVARAAEAKEKWPMRLSTSSIHYMGLPIEQACEQIAALGYAGIDIWSAHQGCPHLDDVQKRLGPDGLKALLAKTKLELE